MEKIQISPKFSIIVTGWNCQRYVFACLDSIRHQTVKDYEVIVIDDGSSDFTKQAIGEFMHNHNLLNKGWKFFGIPTNVGTFYARDVAIQKATGDIIVMVDFDDQLLPNALYQVGNAYERNPECLMTYGNYKYANGVICPVDLHYSPEVWQARSFREDPTWRCTHLRTFKKSLYKRIPPWSLTKAEIQSYPDVEILFSMMEMAGQHRIEIIEVPVYIYNTDNPHFTLKRFGKDWDGYKEICKRPKRELI